MGPVLVLRLSGKTLVAGWAAPELYLGADATLWSPGAAQFLVTVALIGNSDGATATPRVAADLSEKKEIIKQETRELTPT